MKALHFYAVSRNVGTPFTMHDLETIVGVSLFEDSADRNRVFADDEMSHELRRCVDDGTIHRALEEVERDIDGRITARVFACRRFLPKHSNPRS